MPPIETIVAVATGVPTVCGVAWKYCVKPVQKGLKRTRDTFGKVDQISAALGPNGGSSLADKINSIDARGLRNEDALQSLGSRFSSFADVLERPLYETDELGHAVRFNHAFELLVGVPSAQLIGMGWVSLITDVDRDRTMTEWAWAVRDRRSYRIHSSLVAAAGHVIHVDLVGRPTINGATGKLLGWMGDVHVLSVRPKP